MFPVFINTVITLRFFLPKHLLMETCTDTAQGIKTCTDTAQGIKNTLKK